MSDMNAQGIARPDIEADIVIAGGGLVGLTAALALASGEAGAPFSVAVVDALDPAAVRDAAYDGRNSSIAYASWRMFEALGLADRLEGKAADINDILVTDGRVREGAAPMFLHSPPPRSRTRPATSRSAISSRTGTCARRYRTRWLPVPASR